MPQAAGVRLLLPRARRRVPRRAGPASCAVTVRLPLAARAPSRLYWPQQPCSDPSCPLRVLGAPQIKGLPLARELLDRVWKVMKSVTQVTSLCGTTTVVVAPAYRHGGLPQRRFTHTESSTRVAVAGIGGPLILAAPRQFSGSFNSVAHPAAARIFRRIAQHHPPGRPSSSNPAIPADRFTPAGYRFAAGVRYRATRTSFTHLSETPRIQKAGNPGAGTPPSFAPSA